MKWVSKKFMEWLRRKDCRFCGKPLELDGYAWELHHANHKRESSAYYARMCRTCHSKYHLNESVWNKEHGMNKDSWNKHCVENMKEYVESLNVDPVMVCLAALTEAAKENEYPKGHR